MDVFQMYCKCIDFVLYTAMLVVPQAQAGKQRSIKMAAAKQYRPRLSERETKLILQSLGHRISFYERIARKDGKPAPTAPAYGELVALYDSMLNKAPGGASQRRYNHPNYVANSAHANN